MLTLHKRLDHQKDEVLQVCENYGIFRAMDQFKVASYDRFQIWLKEVTGNENFGLHPKLDLSNRQPLGDQVVEAFLRKVAAMEKTNIELEKRNRFLEWQLNQHHEKDLNQAMAVMEVCK